MMFSASFLLIALALGVFPSVSAAPISSAELQAKSAQGLRLLRLEDGADPVWKTEEEKLELMRAEIHFFDITEVYDVGQVPKVKGLTMSTTYPAPSHQSAVKPILSTVSVSNMQSNLATLSAFNNRYYKSSTGAQASTWILNTVKSIANGKSSITVSAFPHSWGQSSVIAKIAGKASSPVTILGAHMDSINLSSPQNGRAPGGDDDGTGTVNLIEAFRALVAAGFTPSTPVEFHWYSGEEAGLLGSQAIVKSYKSKNIAVKAFMELDMSGYFKPGTKEVFALEADYIDTGLNTFLKSLITTYSAFGWAMDIPCGYACSDHASWHDAGYPSSFPYEAITGDDDPNIHSSSDTTSVSGFSWNHSLEFAKLGVAFVYEMSI